MISLQKDYKVNLLIFHICIKKCKTMYFCVNYIVYVKLVLL